MTTTEFIKMYLDQGRTPMGIPEPPFHPVWTTIAIMGGAFALSVVYSIWF